MDEHNDNPTAEQAEEYAFGTAELMLHELERVEVPRADLEEWAAERLSFLLARDNFDCFLRLYRDGAHVPAGSMARALFEEAMRWSWVDEDMDARRGAFLGTAAHRYAQVQQDAEAQGIDHSMFYGPLVEEVVVPAAQDQPRFPSQVEQVEWGLGTLPQMLYMQYRLLSQYTHSSLLAAASTAEAEGDRLISTRRLPVAARLTVLRNAAANMGVIYDGCKLGLRAPPVPLGVPPLNLRLMIDAGSIAEAVHPHAPSSG